MRKLFISGLLALSLTSITAQQYLTRNGTVSFFSETPVENIEAVNNQVSSVLDLDKGEFAFLVPIKAFAFEKALMQEHFNENYLESGQYPKASFKGTIAQADALDLSTDGEYPVVFKGIMNIHGTDQEIEEQATLIIKDGKLSLKSAFRLRPEDYRIKIPAGKRSNIAEILDISVDIDYEKK